jgi:hypothetical protein
MALPANFIKNIKGKKLTPAQKKAAAKSTKKPNAAGKPDPSGY